MSINKIINIMKCINLLLIIASCIIYMLLFIYDNICMLVLYMTNLSENNCNTSDIFYYYSKIFINIINQ